MLDGIKFSSIFIAGFECAAHRNAKGRRLDLLESTGHSIHCKSDFEQIKAMGVSVARDGLRWHKIEGRSGAYDWSSFTPMLRAAQETGMQVIWDLCHYGWPDHIDIWSAEFVERFACFARATARLLIHEGVSSRLFCPINEISFWSWAAGGSGIYPRAPGRTRELKRQLVRATLAAVDAIRDIDPDARFVYAEPLIHVISASKGPKARANAEARRLGQWEAWDMISGRLEPELGGHVRYLDYLGLNFYPHNQWYLGGGTIPLGHHDYRPLQAMLAEVHARYPQCRMLIAETGAEGSARPAWLHYVAEEVEAALYAGIPIDAICLYPITHYRGWDNNRQCEVGLLSEPMSNGQRRVYQPLANEMVRQEIRLVSSRSAAAR